MHTKSYASTKEKIIQVTIKLLANEGFHNVTVRKIACAAQVNVAAINYHFGSKNLLINEALKSITNELKDTFLLLKNPDLSPTQRLKSFLKCYSNALFKYPDIIKIFIMQSITDYPVAGEYEDYLKTEGFELLLHTLEELHPGSNLIINQMRVIQLLGSMAFPLIVEDRMFTKSGIDYENEQYRDLYVDILLEHLTQQNTS